MLKRVRMSAVDAAYARELQAEIEAIRKKLLTHPSATEDELNELRR